MADLGEDHAGAEVADPRNGLQLGDGGAKGFDMRVDLLIDPGDGFVEHVDLLEVQGEQEAVVFGHPAAQRLAQGLGRAPDPPMRQLGKPGGVGLAVDQRLDHRPAADPGDVGDRRIELDVGVLQRLLQPLDVAGPLAHQLLAGAQQAALFLRRGIGDEAAADQAMRQQIGQPVASFTSVLRPGTFLTCAALASVSATSPSLRMCQTGFQ